MIANRTPPRIWESSDRTGEGGENPAEFASQNGVKERMNRQQTLLQMREETEEDRFSTVPIVGIQEGKPALDRTGILLSVADFDFLVTAAHDLKVILDLQIPLFITSPRKGDGGIPLIGKWHGTSAKIVDLAVCKLDAQTSGLIRSAGGRFLRVTDTDTTCLAIPGYYLLRGYPHEKQGDPIRYSTVLFPGSPPTDIVYPFDRQFHILLEHSKDIILNDGKATNSPEIKGMSGCGIWRMTSQPEVEWNDWTKDQRKLVAIQTGYVPGQYFKGTWIVQAWALIQDHYPVVREIMSKLLLPR